MNKYFTINVSNGNAEHIGTVMLNELANDVAFTNKIKEVCESHFDAAVEVPLLKMGDYLDGNSGTVEVKVDSTSEFCEEISIEETWLF